MKRKDVKVGELYEVEHYGSYDVVLILDDKAWSDTRFSSWSRHDYRRTGKGNGVAVARRSRLSDNAWWTPDVVQLQKLYPLGTEDAERTERAAARQKSDDHANERKAHLAEVAGRVDVNATFPYRRGYGSGPGYIDYQHVEMSLSDFEELVAELTALRGEITNIGQG